MNLSLSNIQNSVSVHLTAALNDAGYVVYFVQSDVAVVPGYVMGSYAAQAAAGAFDAPVAAFRAQAGYRGVITLADADVVLTRFAMRPETGGEVAPLGGLSLPLLGVEVSPPEPGAFWELGSRMKERTYAFVVLGYARNKREAEELVMLLSEALDPGLPLPVHDHDAGTLDLLDYLDVDTMTPGRCEPGRAGDAMAYEVAVAGTLWHAR